MAAHSAHAQPRIVPSHSQPHSQSASSSIEVDELARVFNTALISSRADRGRDFSKELATLVQSPAFRAILGTVDQLAKSRGITSQAAALELIQTFRQIDDLWLDFVTQEGVDKITSAVQSPNGP